jgi:hypothetical protein
MFRHVPFLLALGLLAGAAHAQEREWMLDASDQDAYLIFGVPETDDVGVSLWCRIGKGAVNIYLPVATQRLTADQNASEDNAAPLTIAAGGETATFRGKADINREADVSSLEAEIEDGHPLITALQGADRFTVKAGGSDVIFPLFNADVEGLLALCRKP